MSKNLTFLTVIVITAIGAFIRLYDLSSRPPFFPDEEVYYRTAEYYAFGIVNPLYMQLQNGIFIIYSPNHVNYEHPLLGKLIMALGLLLFGNSLLSARLIVSLFNIISIPFVYLIGRKLLTNNKALLFTALYAIDPLNVSLSRAAMLDSLCLFFFVLGLFAYIYVRDSRLRYLLITLMFALAFAVKLTMLPLIISLILIGIFELKNKKPIAISFSLALVFLVFILTYLPYFYSSVNISILPPQYKYLDYGSHTFFDFLNLINWIYLYNFYWHMSNNFYYPIYDNPFYYTLYQNGVYQMFNSNPLIILSGIPLLILYPYYNLFIKKTNEHFLLLTLLFLPQAFLFFLKGLSWYLVVFNFMSLLIVLDIKTKSGSLSDLLYFLLIFSIFVSSAAMTVVYFLFQ
ncbi:MAG TPA: glycosyltransferase family 39 protein [Geobacterales bacterium]|nr:glycosyltransferase family 39 protein [Geobacterales bacterium]